MTRFAWLSVGAAVVTIGLKVTAYLTTNSVGLLADTAESMVNLITALLVLNVLRIAAQPPDEKHPYGHEKAEYFSSGFEGGLICVAAAGIAVLSLQRFYQPQPIQQISLGLILTLAASLINLAVARVLLKAAREHRSITLEADARHLMTDFWSSVAVLSAIGLVGMTGWIVLDPVVAIALSLHIAWIGLGLVYRSMHGLMDRALPEEEVQSVMDILAEYRAQGIHYHALRTRQSGARRFISVHIQVPGDWTVQEGHDLLEQIEERIRLAVGTATVLTHLEPVEDPTSWQDQHLDRSEFGSPASESRPVASSKTR